MTLEVIELTKKFNELIAVEQISFTIDIGEIVGLLGPNGSGKSTTMKMLAGFLPPTAGTAKICGYDIIEESIAAKRIIGYLPEKIPIYPEMTVIKFLRFIGKLRGLDASQIADNLEKILSKIKLESVLNRPIATLSKGFHRRLGLTQALIHDPIVLILDEPLDGLDLYQKQEFIQLLSSITEDKIIILSSHVLDEVAKICQRVIFLESGKIKIDDKVDKLTYALSSHNAITIKIQNASRHQINSALSEVEKIDKIEWLVDDGGMCIKVYPKSGDNLINEINKIIVANNWTLIDFHCVKGQLEEIVKEHV